MVKLLTKKFCHKYVFEHYYVENSRVLSWSVPYPPPNSMLQVSKSSVSKAQILYMSKYQKHNVLTYRDWR